jgi:putative molybdenum carrier protein
MAADTSNAKGDAALTVVSGGQTGADRAALDVALELGLPCGGWCPRGRRAEDGAIPARYPLRETPSDEYRQRTEWNVHDSDGTLILHAGRVDQGTALTERLARARGRPLLVLDVHAATAAEIARWIDAHAVRRLNVAGPRESRAPGLQAAVAAVLREVLRPRRP